ncbi:MAG: hypothetical protein ACP5NF_01300 [Thermoanaerobaculum sp.]
MEMTVLPESFAERLAHLEGWKAGHQAFSEHLAHRLTAIEHRLERLEDQVRFLDQKWEHRLDAMEERWEARFAELRTELKRLDERWETRFHAPEARWESRLLQLQARIWWLMGLQFTNLLAIPALLAK